MQLIKRTNKSLAAAGVTLILSVKGGPTGDVLLDFTVPLQQFRQDLTAWSEGYKKGR